MTIEEIKVTFDKGEFEQAYSDLSNLVLSHKESYLALNNRGQELIASNETESAEFQEVSIQFGEIVGKMIELLKLQAKCAIAITLSNVDTSTCKESTPNKMLIPPISFLNSLVNDIDHFFKIDAELRGFIERRREAELRNVLTSEVVMSTNITCAAINLSVHTKIMPTLDENWIHSEKVGKLLMEKNAALQSESLYTCIEEFRLEPDYVYSNDDLCLEKYAAATVHFEKVKSYYQKYSFNLSTEDAKIVGKYLLDNLAACTLLLSANDEEINKFIREKLLRLHMDILYFELDAKITSNGVTISLLQGESRNKALASYRDRMLDLCKLSCRIESKPLPTYFPAKSASNAQAVPAQNVSSAASDTPRLNVGKLVRSIVALVLGVSALYCSLFVLLTSPDQASRLSVAIVAITINIVALILGFTGMNGGKKAVAVPAVIVNLFSILMALISLAA